MMYWNGMGWGGWVMMTITVVAFWALVAAVVVALFRATRGDLPRNDRQKSPLDLLDERLAEGDITEEDYHRRRDLLTGHAATPR
jgi:putative membrane protein